MPIDYALGLNGLKSGVVTSSTRPASPYAGMQIFESDTGRSLMYDGTGWVIMSEPVNTVTPTVTGMATGTGGSPLNSLIYHRSDGYLDFIWQWQFGTTGQTFPSTPILTLPIASAVLELNFTGNLLDNTVFRYTGLLLPNTSSTMSVNTFASSPGLLTTTSPFTWGSNDGMYFNGRYRMTTRYS